MTTDRELTLFKQWPDVDDAVARYVEEMLSDVEQNNMPFEECVETVVMMTEGTSFGTQSVEEITAWLLSQVQKASTSAADSTCEPTLGSPAPTDVLNAPSHGSAAWLSGLMHASCSTQDHTNLPAGADDVNGAEPGPDEATLDTLTDLIAGAVGRDYLRHVLEQHCGCTESAASWLLERDDLASMQSAWQRQHAQEAKEREAADKEQRRVRKEMVSKYAFQVQANSAEGPRYGKRGALASQTNAAQPWGHTSKQPQADGKVRYRDGMKVTSKGEKYITQIDKDEWDGGSTGKVYTKGKRGKGFS